MKDVLNIFGFLLLLVPMVGVVLFSMSGVIYSARTGYEKFACPSVAELQETEYKIVAGDCYLKTPKGNWIIDTEYKKMKFIDSLNMSDEAKLVLIKDIDK